MNITVDFGGGEERQVQLDGSATVKTLQEQGVIGTGATVTVNDTPANASYQLRDGDTVSVLPKSGKQGC